jgi:hypothetical protein
MANAESKPARNYGIPETKRSGFKPDRSNSCTAKTECNRSGLIFEYRKTADSRKYLAEIGKLTFTDDPDTTYEFRFGSGGVKEHEPYTLVIKHTSGNESIAAFIFGKVFEPEDYTRALLLVDKDDWAPFDNTFL